MTQILLQVTPAPDTLSQALFVACERLLGPQELQRLARLRRRRRKEFLLSRALLRSLLSRLGVTDLRPKDWSLIERVDLPPQVPEAEAAGLHFAISHSAGVVAVAVCTQGPIGVDLEQWRSRDFLAIAADWFHPAETQQLQVMSAPRQSKYFYRWWTLKEAFLKARLLGIGSGLTRQMRFSLYNPEKRYSPEKKPLSSGAWYAQSTEFDNFSLSLVSRQRMGVRALRGIPWLGLPAQTEPVEMKLQLYDLDILEE